MSVAGAGGGADAGADTAGVHTSNGREVGMVEDGELEGQPALDMLRGVYIFYRVFACSRRLCCVPLQLGILIEVIF